MAMRDAFDRTRGRGTETAQRGLVRACTKLEEAENALLRTLRAHSRGPVPISSHPEADPEVLASSEAAIAYVREDFRRGPQGERGKPIVSINGADVDADDDKRRVA